MVSRSDAGGICIKCHTPFEYDSPSQKYMFSTINKKYLDEALVDHVKALFRKHTITKGMIAREWHAFAQQNQPAVSMPEPVEKSTKETSSRQTTSSEPESQVSEQSSKRSKKGLIAAIVSVVSVVALGTAGYLLIQNVNRKMTDTVEELVAEQFEEYDLTDEVTYGEIHASTVGGSVTISNVIWTSASPSVVPSYRMTAMGPINQVSNRFF